MNVRKIPKKTITIIEPKKSLIVDKEKHHQKRVAAYCRVSTDSDEQLTSYVTQKKVYTEMIAKNPEWEFAGLYADEGISGTRADKRPQFKQMIKDCLAGKIEYAQFLHDGSEVKYLENAQIVGDSMTNTFMLPVNKPKTIIPVIEVFLK